jgi:F0F1-type ATP synthase assembly protein I
MKRDSSKDEYKDWFKTYARIGYISLFFPGCILVGYICGNWLDGKLKSKPAFTLTLIILGFAAALRTLLKEIDWIDDNDKKK